MTFDVRRLGPGDLGLLLGLQERIAATLPEPGIFQTSTPEFIAYCLADGGLCYGVTHHGETVAYRFVYFPHDRPFNLAKDSALPPDEHAAVGHWDTVAVLPGWRGHGLARLMNVRALADVADTGIRHLFATSSPLNPHGVRTLSEAGFQPIDLIRKFGGKLRFLLYRPSPQGWPAVPAGTPERTVPFPDTGALEGAFRDGWTGAGLVLDGPGPARLRMHRRPPPFGAAQR
ncbi:GNAT family N-acetyltransferase [Streptoverticillium reticulum]|uniref:GNAT family N-acetyltransferase n=1 Tax=Streptoverticillium reticulum TaxID=1433415 RepID=UPI0039BF20A2